MEQLGGEGLTMHGLACGRRLLLPALCLVLVSCGGGGGGDSSAAPNNAPTGRFFADAASVPRSGPDVPDVARFDQIMTGLLKDYDVPGATLAIAKNGRLVLARGYGYADFEARQTMPPDAMFRIASVSKVLTSMAVLHLKDQGLLRLDDKYLDILTEYQVPPSGDARHRDATVRNLLNHSGGWDSSMTTEASNDDVARALGVSLPLKTPDALSYYLTRTLQFDPGTRFHYSNIGYCILGLVVEKASGQTYEHYVRDNVLLPMDVHAMSIGRSGVAGRGPTEVKYYQYDGAPPLADSYIPGQGKVPTPYAGDMSYCPASGSWIASTVDLTRVMTAIDGSRVGPFLSADTMVEYTANPNLPPFVPNEWWGLGIAIGPTPDAWSHGGFGTTVAILQRTSTYTWAVVTSSWPLEVDAFVSKVHGSITDALKTPFEGSPNDLYAQYPSPALPASEP